MSEILFKDLVSYETFVHAIAGSTGSVVAMTAFYPLDTVRSRIQLEDRDSRNSWQTIQELVKEEGLTTLYRGIMPVLKSLWVSNFVYFYTFHGLKILNNGDQSAGRDLLLASVAGVTNVLTTTPLWVVNTRLKMEGIKNKQNQKYNGLLDGLIKIKKKEGIKALWNGTLPSLILVLNPAIQFMVYESLKRYIKKIYPGITFASTKFFLIGAISKAVATVVTYPLQLIQTKLRHGHNYSDLPKNVDMIKLLLYLIRKQGVSGLYRGMEAKILQTVLTAALMFATYEKITLLVFRLFRSQKRI